VSKSDELVDKYDRLSKGFSEREYADPRRYYVRRAQAVIENGPRLAPGDSLLDLGCGDGLAAVPLIDYGLAYHGVDASPQMIEVAREHLGDRARFEVGEIERFAPPEPVDATTCFRAVYYASDLRAFFAHVRSYTRKKFLFDFALRDFPRGRIVGDLEAAGFSRVELKPFLYPQHYAPGAAADAALRALERSGPLAYPLLKLRFTYIVAAIP
jgi:predicted TPR repeat methyltransferase